MKKRVFFYGVAALISVSTFFYSCKNDENQLSLNSSNTSVILVDTFSVFTRTVPEDSFPTHRFSVYLLGATNNTNFGKNNAEVIMNFALPNITNFLFPASSKIDSAFLVLQYAGTSLFNGDLNTPMNVKAYELTEKIFYDSVYYSNRKYAFNATPINNITTTFRLFDSVKVSFKGNTQTQAPQLRLKLDNLTFGTKLINGSALNFASNNAFQDYIKGIRVAIDDAGLAQNSGAVAYLNLFSGLSGIHVYYNDTSFVQFPVRDISAVANTYTNNFAGTPIQTQFSNLGNYNNGYLQTMDGTRIQVDIPGLKNIAQNDDYAIIGATLEFSPEVGSIDPGFAAPTRLLLLARDSNNNASLVVDAINEPTIFNGNYNSNKFRYEFNIPRHVQLLLSDLRQRGIDYNKGFFIRVPSDKPITATRLLVNTQKGTAQGIKFSLRLIKVK